jgi:DNA-binding MarR family transcriptional regulator
MMISRLLVLANIISRSAVLLHKRTTGLSATEFGLVASLGESPPMSVAAVADAMGRDKGQISRALAGLVSRKLVERTTNPDDSREILVSLTKLGLAVHDRTVSGATERNRQLVAHLSDAEVTLLLNQIDRLTQTASNMLAAEKR